MAFTSQSVRFVSRSLDQAMASPDAVIDEVATSTIEQDYPGIDPFPCTVGSPGGAFDAPDR
jgi:hypothetical protein